MKQQQGSVLIITVAVLFAATMISLYAMRGTIIQDKMTANINNKVTTTNVAEEGATQFLNWFGGRFKTGGPGWPSSEQSTVWQGNIGNGLIPYDDPVDGVVNTGNIQNGRYYWIKKNTNISGCTELNTNPCWNDDNHQVTVQITGNLIKGTGKDTKILGESIYQVTIAAPGGISLPKLPAAITLGGPMNTFGGPNSGNFKVQGGGEAAIATMRDSSYTTVVTTLQNNGVSNSFTGSNCTGTPCVTKQDLGIWGKPNDLMAYLDTIKNDSPNVQHFAGSATSNDLDVTKPVIIVEGNFKQNGKFPDGGSYKGILIVLGASSSSIGGGGGTNFTGGMYFANITGTVGNYSFGNVELTINGGHMMTTYDNSNMSDSNNGGGLNNKTTVLAWSEVCANPSCT